MAAMNRGDEAQTERYRLASQAIFWVGVIGLIVAIGFVVDPIAHVLAGRRTSVSFRFDVTVAISLAGVAAVLIAVARVRSLSKDNGRLRRRVTSLERENERLRMGIGVEQPSPRLPGV